MAGPEPAHHHATITNRPTRRVVRFALEFVPPFGVALVILPFVIAYGTTSPWRPSTIDLEVYVYAVNDMLAGKDIFATKTPFWNLYFIYPPIAAVLMVPLAVGPYAMWQVIWTGGLVLAQQSVLRRSGMPRGWKLGLVGIAVVLAVEPIRTTLGYGQVNTMLMALVVADLLPDRPGERRRIPPGTLIGLAAAIKLTPALFVIFAFLIGRRRPAITAMVSFVLFTGLGAIFQFSQTVAFWSGLSGGDTRTASPLYAGNQSLLGVFYRLGDSSRTTTLIGLGCAGLVALGSAAVAAHWWRRGEKVFAVAVVGLGTCLASPLSWTHHYVWIVPLAAAVLSRTLPRWIRGVAGFWVLWVCACLPLAALPYGGGRERNFTLGQDVIANLGPLLGVALLIALGATALITHPPSRPTRH
jgi:alpha-1,2-mannosyltransferase